MFIKFFLEGVRGGEEERLLVLLISTLMEVSV